MAIARWIGGFLGLLSGGPLGALAGFALGSLYEYLTERDEPAQTTYRTTTQQERTSGQSGRTYTRRQTTSSDAGTRNGFLFSMMLLSVHVMQADGKIMHSEMECMRRFLRQNFGETSVAQGEDIIKRLNEKRKQMGDAAWQQQITACCQQIAGVMTEAQRLQLLSYLVAIAQADGLLPQSEIDCLHGIAINLGLSADEVDQLLGMGKDTLQAAYQVLGISPDATDDEVRKAYRQMALKHHPDKVATLGEDVRKAAEQKFKDITAAKDLIFKARGMN